MIREIQLAADAAIRSPRAHPATTARGHVVDRSADRSGSGRSALHKSTKTAACSALSEADSEEMIWRAPEYTFSDWIELCTLLSPSGGDPTVVDAPSYPLSTGAALRRSLLLTFAHRIAGRAWAQPSTGRRSYYSVYLEVPRPDRMRFENRLRSAARFIGQGANWLEDSTMAYDLAAAQWRGMLLATPRVRAADMSLNLRAGSSGQARSLIASCAALGVTISVPSSRREEQYRLRFDPDQAIALHRALMAHRGAASTRGWAHPALDRTHRG
jgi:hypothetical protein